jgi:D-alanyl-D-alanine carboxypeptidase
MATPQGGLRAFFRARQPRAAAVAEALTLMSTFAGPPGTAHATSPDVAQRRSALMYRSLTLPARAAQLRTTLATQRTAVNTQAAAVTQARTASDAAQAQVTAATTAATTAQTRYTAARQVLTTATQNLNRASRQKPRSRTAVVRAKTAVTAATTKANLRRTQAQQAAATLSTARTSARTATVALDSAVGSWTAATSAVRLTEQQIAGLGTAAAFAGQATALSRDVVTQVRASFTLADTTVIYGITVHSSVSFAFKRMLDAAKADGISMSGGGFRTTQRQIELRSI